MSAESNCCCCCMSIAVVPGHQPVRLLYKFSKDERRVKLEALSCCCRCCCSWCFSFIAAPGHQPVRQLDDVERQCLAITS
jgi:hypothetical protein